MARKRASIDSSRPATRAAASIGSALSTVASRVDNWLAQREDIAQELNMILGRAQNMLASLGNEAEEVERRTMKMPRKTAREVRRKARRSV